MNNPVSRESADRLGALLHEVADVADGPGSKRGKFHRLVRLADEANAIVAPTTPCRRGCSHCCHIAVAISHAEAEVIAQATGLKIEEQPTVGLRGTFDRINGNVKLYSGVPCTFLDTATGFCTIYEARPVACRTHHTIAPDSSNCEVTQGSRGVPQVDFRRIDMAVGWVLRDEPFADIRQFFPIRRSNER